MDALGRKGVLIGCKCLNQNIIMVRIFLTILMIDCSKMQGTDEIPWRRNLALAMLTPL